MPGTRVKGEEWFPVKCDMVAKQAVMDRVVNNQSTQLGALELSCLELNEVQLS